MRRIPVLLAAAFAVAACNSSNTTGMKAGDQLHFLQLSATAPPFANAADSFWAVKGQDRRLTIYFRPAAGMVDSAKLLEFRVTAPSLFRRPDGSLIADGDSVLIHVSVLDPVKMIVAFAPSGLQFAQNNPARLTFDFNEADPDINGDGHVDASDDTAKTMLHVWRQETAAAAWQELPGLVDVSIDEVEADIAGFSNYALAF